MQRWRFNLPGRIGTRIVAYIEKIGRIEGRIARLTDHGFAVALATTPARRDKLANQLTWLANKHILKLPEDRRHERVAPGNPFAKLFLPDGKWLRGKILDVSPSGAAVQVEPKPEIGTPVVVGKMRGVVVRRSPDVIGIEFSRVHDETLLHDFFY
ncbi:PilZ domain-containing protein [Siculibacillus lacustris]|uniref:PilZ domain-containing protein n=1 Tax=Siculibacillus lacustris TaxID=1549641 RepID=UPI002B053E46|nr:PilZ domain-containing protein [Siculibacillus lacustris]